MSLPWPDNHGPRCGGRVAILTNVITACVSSTRSCAVFICSHMQQDMVRSFEPPHLGGLFLCADCSQQKTWIEKIGEIEVPVCVLACDHALQGVCVFKTHVDEPSRVNQLQDGMLAAACSGESIRTKLVPAGLSCDGHGHRPQTSNNTFIQSERALSSNT